MINRAKWGHPHSRHTILSSCHSASVDTPRTADTRSCCLATAQVWIHPARQTHDPVVWPQRKCELTRTADTRSCCLATAQVWVHPHSRHTILSSGHHQSAMANGAGQVAAAARVALVFMASVASGAMINMSLEGDITNERYYYLHLVCVCAHELAMHVLRHSVRLHACSCACRQHN